MSVSLLIKMMFIHIAVQDLDGLETRKVSHQVGQTRIREETNNFIILLFIIIIITLSTEVSERSNCRLVPY